MSPTLRPACLHSKRQIPRIWRDLERHMIGQIAPIDRGASVPLNGSVVMVTASDVDQCLRELRAFCSGDLDRGQVSFTSTDTRRLPSGED